MEPVWNGMLTCDYEHTRREASLLEWDLYTRSLINWPRILMDDPTPYGQLRRPGIVDIPEDTHTHLLTRWHAHLADPEQVRVLIARANQHRRHTARAFNAVDDALESADTTAATTALAEATRAFLAVMSTHIVNWLLPEQQWEDRLTSLFGDRYTARDCLAALMTPSSPGHLLDAHSQKSTTASPSKADHITDIHAITLARGRATALRQAWYTAAVLAAAGNDHALRVVHTMTPLCQWAADSEERRKELRHRYLATTRRWCTVTGADPAQITIDSLLGQRTSQ